MRTHNYHAERQLWLDAFLRVVLTKKPEQRFRMDWERAAWMYQSGKPAADAANEYVKSL